jgi:quercetin dioxygenase-like cupin family protein
MVDPRKLSIAMRVTRITDHEQKDVWLDGAADVRMRMLIGPDDGAATFHMRHFEFQPGGHTPRHAHNYEHEALVLRGRGVMKSESGDLPFQVGDVIWVPANEKHQFCNIGSEPLEIVCLIPAPQACA